MLLPALRTLLRIYFRRVEVVGSDRVPASGATIFCPNHPNSLLDPLVLFASVPRPVATLAAEPLFRKPVLGAVMRAIGAIPVHRREDAADRGRNRDTFASARSHLAGGGAVAIFPEGVSHDDPSLRPFRTGAARIALGATGTPVVTLVPVGLFYLARARFRSDALLCFGEPIQVSPLPLVDGEPPADVVQRLTQELESGLRRLVLQAEERKALKLVSTAERIFTTAEGADAELRTVLRRRQRFVEEYARLQRDDPDRLRRLEARVRRYDRWLRATGLEPEHLPASGYRPSAVVRMIGFAVLALGVLMPLATVGLVVHFPAWHLTRWLANRMHRRSGRGEDVLGTMKLTVALVAYPATWGLLAVGGWLGWGLFGAMVALTAGPVTGFLALRFRERFQRLTATLRGLLVAIFGTRLYVRLLAERRRLRDEFARLDSQRQSDAGAMD